MRRMGAGQVAVGLEEGVEGEMEGGGDDGC